MDDFELASQHEEMRRKIARGFRKPAGPAPKIVDGVCCCHYCDEPVPEGARWCNAECREDWEALDRAEKMRPRCDP